VNPKGQTLLLNAPDRPGRDENVRLPLVGPDTPDRGTAASPTDSNPDSAARAAHLMVNRVPVGVSHSEVHIHNGRHRGRSQAARGSIPVKKSRTGCRRPFRQDSAGFRETPRACERSRESPRRPQTIDYLGFCGHHRRSATYAGHRLRRPFKAVARVRIPLGAPCGAALKCAAVTITAPGPVAQLVSASPCHGEGRGFESRRGRPCDVAHTGHR
jgi:hypothetical protein